LGTFYIALRFKSFCEIITLQNTELRCDSNLLLDSSVNFALNLKQISSLHNSFPYDTNFEYYNSLPSNNGFPGDYCQQISPTDILPICVYTCVFCGGWRAPQQMLRTHRSIEAYCATLWWRRLVFPVFPCNEALVEWNWQGKNRSTWGKTCPSATLSNTNTTWTDPGSNPCLRGERPATNRLSHSTAIYMRVLSHAY
jgi:hypothetical protein